MKLSVLFYTAVYRFNDCREVVQVDYDFSEVEEVTVVASFREDVDVNELLPLSSLLP